MRKPKLTPMRIAAALAISVIADVIQFPITAVEATGFLSLPGMVTDFMLDCVVMVAMTRLIGFHWMFLPSLIVEVIPGVDLLPTWTACAAYVIWQRKKEQSSRPPPNPEILEAEIVPEPPPLLTASTVKDFASKNGRPSSDG